MEIKLTVDATPDLLNALNAIAKAMSNTTTAGGAPATAPKTETKRAPTKKKVAPKKETPKEEAEAEQEVLDPPKEEKKTDGVKHKLEDVIAALRVVNNEKSSAAAKAVISKFGVKSVRDLKEAQYGAVIEAASNV